MKTREEQRFELAKAIAREISPGLGVDCNEAKAARIASRAVMIADALLAELDQTAPKPEVPAFSSGEWISWVGCPCPTDLPCEVKFRNGVTTSIDRPQDLYWIQDGSEVDIVAFRIP